jgi:hypothetical protein
MTTHGVSGQTLLDLGWLFFLSVVFLYFWRGRQVTAQTKYWVETQGQITEFEWVTQGRHIWPKVQYMYSVGEIDFIGEHLFLDTTHNDPHSKYAREMTYKVANAYKNNENISVYYNPDNPQESVLDTTIPRKINLILMFIAVLIFVHIIVMISRI